MAVTYSPTWTDSPENRNTFQSVTLIIVTTYNTFYYSHKNTTSYI